MYKCQSEVVGKCCWLSWCNFNCCVIKARELWERSGFNRDRVILEGELATMVKGVHNRQVQDQLRVIYNPIRTHLSSACMMVILFPPPLPQGFWWRDNSLWFSKWGRAVAMAILWHPTALPKVRLYKEKSSTCTTPRYTWYLILSLPLSSPLPFPFKLLKIKCILPCVFVCGVIFCVVCVHCVALCVHYIVGLRS